MKFITSKRLLISFHTPGSIASRRVFDSKKSIFGFLLSWLSVFAIGQVQLSGNMRISENWEKIIYVYRIDQLSRPKGKLIDSISVNGTGDFAYSMSRLPFGALLYRFELSPSDHMDNRALMIFDDYDFILALRDGIHINISASADSLYSSLSLMGDNLNVQVLNFRKLKRPYHELMRHYYPRLKANPDSMAYYQSLLFEKSTQFREEEKETLKERIASSTQDELSIAGLYYLNETYLGSIDFDYLNSFLKKTSNREYQVVNALKEQLQKGNSTRVGLIIPNVILEDQFGRSHELHELKSQYIVIDYWASYCIPCREAIRKELKKLHSDISDKNVLMIGISIDRDPLHWKMAISEDKPGWLQFKEKENDKSMQQILDIAGVPKYFVLDSNFKVVKEAGSFFELDSFIKGLK